MERLLPSDGIDAIEKRKFGRFGLQFVCRRGHREKYPREAKTILAGSTVQYLAGTKIRAQPGAPNGMGLMVDLLDKGNHRRGGGALERDLYKNIISGDTDTTVPFEPLTKPRKATDEEVKVNIRSRSATLRVSMRI